DCIILGSSVYAGSIRKEAKAFLAKNADALQDQKFGLFLSGLEYSEEKKYFDGNFPQDMLQSAKAASFLGGIFDPQKANAIERTVMKAVSKQSGYMNLISEEKIKQFAEIMKT
ncbi:MAG: flavodoxin domain-containing protein, partial [Oscillospiraceae bacterium]|nr:flavodoxin domain-containing protein [Oscillospiraceae bacterium]